MRSCNKHIGPGQYDTCYRPAHHEPPCRRFSPETRIEYMRAMVKEGRPNVTEAELDDMERDFWGRERETVIADALDDTELDEGVLINALQGGK